MNSNKLEHIDVSAVREADYIQQQNVPNMYFTVAFSCFWQWLEDVISASGDISE